MTGGSLLSALPETTIITRLVVAMLLGACIGLDREIKRRPAGLRTHILVTLAAAAFTLITIEVYQDTLKEAGNAAGARADPIRVVEAVTAGVAFIAAGAIIRHSDGDVQGVTTGAAIWLAGAIGVACGIGYYIVAIVTTVLAILVLQGLGWVESRVLKTDDDAAGKK
ncbi:MgtC/SapB family protein [Leptospira interrogans]